MEATKESIEEVLMASVVDQDEVVLRVFRQPVRNQPVDNYAPSAAERAPGTRQPGGGRAWKRKRQSSYEQVPQTSNQSIDSARPFDLVPPQLGARVHISHRPSPVRYARNHDLPGISDPDWEIFYGDNPPSRSMSEEAAWEPISPGEEEEVEGTYE